MAYREQCFDEVAQEFTKSSCPCIDLGVIDSFFSLLRFVKFFKSSSSICLKILDGLGNRFCWWVAREQVFYLILCCDGQQRIYLRRESVSIIVDNMQKYTLVKIIAQAVIALKKLSPVIEDSGCHAIQSSARS